MPCPSSWREILNPEKPLTKLTKDPEQAPSDSIVSPFVGTQNPEFSRASESIPLKSTDKTDKSLTPEQAEALQLLNLAGVRIMRYDSELRLGTWGDLDGTELRAAINVVGMDELRVVHLESAEVPIRFKIRSCPDRNPGESFEAWRQRALRETPQPTQKSA
ncbi:MAG: hypothetical protein ACR2JB_04410 [Bryobacteraceae bacterium]